MRKSFDVNKPAQVDAFKKELISRSRKAALKATHATAVKVVQYIQSTIIPKEKRQPVDRGRYRAAWRARPRPYGADVFNTVPYAMIIEHGARAKNIKTGRKMIDALTKWVQRKGIVPKKQGQFAARAMAWQIARSMKRKGIFNEGKGLKILGRALPHVPKWLAAEMKRELKKAFAA